MEEIWKDITGYEGYYQVSNLGRVKSLERKIATNSPYSDFRTMKSVILNQMNGKGKDKYFRVSLSKEGTAKQWLVHRLVAEAFLSMSEKNPIVNHIDENKQNNCVGNLEWCDYSFNSSYGKALDLKSRSVKATNLTTGETKIYKSMTYAEKDGFKQGNISKVCRGLRKKHGGCFWEYI